MFTVCPKCALTLVVTAADLRVAQGYVRCGRCSSVFNALARLTDERQAMGAAGEADAPVADLAAAAEPDAPAPTQTPAPPRHEPEADDEAIPEDALEFNPATTDVAAVFVDPPANPQWTAATGSFKAMIAANQEPAPTEPSDLAVDVEIDAAFLASMLRAEPPAPARDVEPSAPQASEPASAASEPAPQSSQAVPPVRETKGKPAAAPRSAVPAAGTTPVTRSTPAARHAVPHTRPPVEAAARPPPAAAAARTYLASEPRHEVRIPPAALELADESDDLTADEESASGDHRQMHSIRARLAPQRWHIGVALAAMVLAVQIVNHYRDELAATARFNRPLTALYSSLGVQLAPHWDLRAYDVRQLGASVDPAAGGLITVRASIKNAASQAQPLPLLRVTLQDRFGNRIAARDVAPRFYLPHAMPAASFLSGGQRIDAEMAFVDPGANAVGFEIDACLPASGGGVACANDAGAR
jgi:predicted Zn finger-like uncharacterized protein